MKITEYLGLDEDGNYKFVVAMKSPNEDKGELNPYPTKIHVCHDYVRFDHMDLLYIEPGKLHGKYFKNPIDNGSTNSILVPASVTIQIKDMIEIVLPYLKDHKYLQKEHLQDRVWNEDDECFKKYNLTEPRWKKGDKYPAYAHNASVLFINGIVYLRRNGEKIYSQMSFGLYNTVKKHLKLYLNKWSFEQENNDKV